MHRGTVGGARAAGSGAGAELASHGCESLRSESARLACIWSTSWGTWFCPGMPVRRLRVDRDSLCKFVPQPPRPASHTSVSVLRPHGLSGCLIAPPCSAAEDPSPPAGPAPASPCCAPPYPATGPWSWHQAASRSESSQHITNAYKPAKICLVILTAFLCLVARN